MFFVYGKKYTRYAPVVKRQIKALQNIMARGNKPYFTTFTMPISIDDYRRCDYNITGMPPALTHINRTQSYHKIPISSLKA